MWFIEIGIDKFDDNYVLLALCYYSGSSGYGDHIRENISYMWSCKYSKG